MPVYLLGGPTRPLLPIQSQGSYVVVAGLFCLRLHRLSGCGLVTLTNFPAWCGAPAYLGLFFSDLPGVLRRCCFLKTPLPPVEALVEALTPTLCTYLTA